MITAVIRNRENTLKGLFGNLILTELNHFFYTFSLTSIVTLHFLLRCAQKTLDKRLFMYYNVIRYDAGGQWSEFSGRHG